MPPDEGMGSTNRNGTLIRAPFEYMRMTRHAGITYADRRAGQAGRVGGPGRRGVGDGPTPRSNSCRQQHAQMYLGFRQPGKPPHSIPTHYPYVIVIV